MNDEDRRVRALDQAVRIEAAAAVDGSYDSARIIRVAEAFAEFLKGDLGVIMVPPTVLPSSPRR